VFWVISVFFNIRNTLPKSGSFLLGHPVYRPFASVDENDLEFLILAEKVTYIDLNIRLLEVN